MRYTYLLLGTFRNPDQMRRGLRWKAGGLGGAYDSISLAINHILYKFGTYTFIRERGIRIARLFWWPLAGR